MQGPSKGFSGSVSEADKFAAIVREAEAAATVTSEQARYFATRLAHTLHNLDLHDWRNADVRRALFNAAEACAQAADAMERSR